jgi:hypothetical protein
MEPGRSGAQVFNVRDFGAAGDGRARDTRAVQAAVDACHAAGGGVAYCPPGDYLIGTVELKSNVDLHVGAGAVLRGSVDRADYRAADLGAAANPLNYGPEHLLFARGAQNVAITGPGTIDGQGDEFFGPRAPGETHLSLKGWRPFKLIAFLECRNVRMEDVTVRNAPGWTIWPLGCEAVSFRGVKIFNNPWGPNTDGIDPDCCRGVTISDCHIEAGDDCIALKSDTAKLGREMACEDVTVTNCTLVTTCCAVRIGYEGDGPIRNCTFSNLAMSRTRTGINMLVPRHAEFGIHHGPTIENIAFSNLVMDTRCPIYLWIGDDAARPGGIRNVSIADAFATTERGCYIGGSRSIPIEGVRISNLRLEVRGEMDDEFGAEVPYPYRVWDYFNKRGIPHAIYCRYARDLEFHDVRVAWGRVSGPWRSALRCEGVAGLDVSGLVARGAPGPAGAPAVHLTDVRGAFLRGCRAEPGAGAFLRLDGPAAGRSTVLGSDLAEAEAAFELSGDAAGKGFHQEANRLRLTGRGAGL